MYWASLIVTVSTVYAALGLVFAIAFVWRGVGRVDPAAAATPIGFRLLILPGVVAFWPLLARRWLRGQGPPEERNAHRRAAREAVARGPER